MEKDTGLLKTIFVGHFIIVLHILLIAAVGLLVLFSAALWSTWPGYSLAGPSP